MKHNDSKLKKNINRVKQVRWLLPGWVFYEYYKTHIKKGDNKTKSIVHGAKAEIMRIAAFTSIPLPGTYELTTTGLSLIRDKIENGEIENLNLKAFKDFIPIKISKNKKTIKKSNINLRIFSKDKKLHFEIFYKEKKIKKS